MSKTSVKLEKWEMHTLEPRLWRVNWKSWKMRNRHCRIWNVTRNTEKREKWEMHTVEPGEWRENWKSWKIRNTVGRELWRETLKNLKKRNTQRRTYIMARKLKNMEYETKSLYDVQNGEKHWKWRKREMHTVVLEYGKKT